MLLFTVFLALLIKQSVSDCNLNPDPNDTAYEEQLHKDMFANYTDIVPPNINNTVIAIKFVLKKFKFTDNEDTFLIYSWMFFHWEDPRLKWNPSDYRGTDKTILHSIFIWTPLGYLESMGDLTDSGDFYHYTHCQITHTGHVMCVLRIIHGTVCLAKFNDWPYDHQICTFKFGIRKGVRENVTFTFNATRGISAFGAEYGAGWDIVHYAVGENDKNETKLYLTFVVERRAEGAAVMIVSPSIILAFITFSSYFLNVRKILRIGVISFSLLSHFKFLEAITDNIPHHGDNSPSVLFYLRSSFLISGLSIILTMVLSALTKRTCKSCEWIERVSDYVYKSHIRYFIIPKWQVIEHTTNEVSSHLKTWTGFANILNTICLIIVFAIYFIMYFMYIPKPIPMDKEYNDIV